MLVIPRQGPYEAREIPVYDEGMPGHIYGNFMRGISAWCGGTFGYDPHTTLGYIANVGGGQNLEIAHPTDFIIHIDDQFKVYRAGDFAFFFKEFGQMREAHG